LKSDFAPPPSRSCKSVWEPSGPWPTPLSKHAAVCANGTNPQSSNTDSQIPKLHIPANGFSTSSRTVQVIAETGLCSETLSQGVNSDDVACLLVPQAQGHMYAYLFSMYIPKLSTLNPLQVVLCTKEHLHIVTVYSYMHTYIRTDVTMHIHSNL